VGGELFHFQSKAETSRNPSVKGAKMTGERASVVFGVTLCLPARSRFGEGRAAPLSVSLQKKILEVVSHPRKAGYPSV